MRRTSNHFSNNDSNGLNSCGGYSINPKIIGQRINDDRTEDWNKENQQKIDNGF